MGALCTASARGGQALLQELQDECSGKQLRATEEVFCDWVASARPGQRFEYHRGSLAHDRMRSTSLLPQHERLALNALAKRVMQVAEAGCVLLVQRRHAEGDLSYIAIRTRHRRHRNRQSIGARESARCRR